MDEKVIRLPDQDAILEELERLRYQERFLAKLKSTTFSLITVAAIAILVKRVIAFPGDWVNIESNGQVYVNTAI